MSIDVLTNLIAPPSAPVDPGNADAWQKVELDLGLVLPSDYKDFISIYGSGQFANFYWVLNPFSEDRAIALFPALEQIGGWTRQFRAEFPERVPYLIYPEPSGLLLWGVDDNGHEYYWLTAGEPDQWQVVSNEVRGLGFEEHGCTMTEYLAGVLHGRIKPLAGGYPTEEDLVFTELRR